MPSEPPVRETLSWTGGVKCATSPENTPPGSAQVVLRLSSLRGRQQSHKLG